MSEPTVSIIIPCYNRELCISESINSALAQTYPFVEVIVVDDGSTDNSMNIIKGFGSRVRFFKKENGGVSSARNVGIHESKGQFLVFLDSDDLISADLIECQVKTSMRWPRADVIGADCAYEKADGTILIQRNDWPDEPSQPLEMIFLNPPPFIHSKMYRRSSVVKAGFFDESLRCAEDSDLLIRVVLSGGFLVKGHGGYALYRPSEDSLTRVTSQLQYLRSYIAQCRKILRDFAKDDVKIMKLTLLRIDYWRHIFWCSILQYHWKKDIREVMISIYYIIQVLIVDPGYLVYLFKARPWNKKI